MALVIPLTPSLLRYQTRQQVDGVELIYDLQWRERVQSWYLSVLLPNETPIITGRRIVSNWSPLLRFVSSSLPDGLYLVVRQGDSDQDPGRDELGTNVLLQFMTRAELDALPPAPNVNAVARVVIA
jgi:hypothetical protein